MNLKFIIRSAAVLLSVAASALGNGTRLPSQDGRAVARGYAVTASNQTSSSVYYNPAGLTGVSGSEVLVGAYAIKPDVEFTSTTGATVEEQSRGFIQPHLFAATELGRRAALGFGLYSPFGQSTDWPTTSGFAGVATFNEIQHLTAAMAAAYKLTDRLSLGASLQYNKARVDLNRLSAISPTALTRFGYTGEDEAITANVGLQWSLNDRHRVGLHYQSRTRFEFHGSAVLEGVLTQPGRLSWVFPDNLAIGWSTAIAPDWEVEFSYDRTFWSSLNTLQLEAGPLSTAIPLDWSDSAYYGIGVTHSIDESLSLSFGYNFSENSVPDATFSPSLPDVDRHLLAAGFFHRRGSWQFQAVLQRGFEASRTIIGPAPDGLGGSFAGTYRNALWAVNVGATLIF